MSRTITPFRLRYALAIVLALFALLTLLDRFVLIELAFRRLAVPALLALATALAAVAVSALVRRTREIDLPVDFLIGYPIFGAAAFAIGTIEVSLRTMIPLVVIGAAGGIWLVVRRYARRERITGYDAALAWPALAVAAVLGCGFVAAQAPPSSLDEVAYHLAVPQAWVLEGRAVDLPLNSHSYFPLGTESADLPLLVAGGAVDGGIASHLLHLLAAIATTVLILRRSGSWLATAAIVTTPALAITAGWSLVEWPLVGLFVALWMLVESDDLRGASAATAAGLLVKYTFIPFASLVWLTKRRMPKWPALLGLVFFVRNTVLTWNPVAPFFSGDAPGVSGFRALALADYVFEGTFVDEALGASILVLPVFAAGSIAAGSAVFALLLFFLGPSSRILVPYLAVAAASAAPELRRRLLRIVVIAAVVVQSFLVIWFAARSDAFSLLAGSKSEEEYLRTQRPSHAAIEWVNAQLPAGSRTLVIGLNETYWFAKPVRGGGNFDGPRLSRYLDVALPEALHARLSADGITHVAVITTPLSTAVEKKRHERETRLSPEAQRMLAQTLDRYADSVAAGESATLFTLR